MMFRPASPCPGARTACPRVRRRHAAALLLAGALGLAGAPGARAATTVSAQVRTAALQRGELTRTVDAVGSVRSAAGHTLLISFERPVRIEQVLVEAGQAVRRGQALLVVGGTAAGRATAARLRTALRSARAELRRVRDLTHRQLATRAQLDAARKNVADARAALAAARVQGLGRSSQRVRAAFDGVVEQVAVDPGTQLAAGSTALRLAPRSDLQAVVGLAPDAARRLRRGMSARVRPVFEPQLQARATVLQVAARVDPASGRVDVYLALPASATWALPGLAVQARLPLRSWHGWVVPRQAVLRDAAGRAYVFQDDHGRARRVDVRVRADAGERSVVAGPLQAAQPLVVVGNYELRDGMALRSAAPAAAARAR